MANSKFSYVRSFERNDALAPDHWIVVSLVNQNDKFRRHVYRDKDSRMKFAYLLRQSSNEVMQQFKELKLAYLHSQSVHFVFDKTTSAYQRRCAKLVSYFASCLTSSCVSNWEEFMKTPVLHTPCFTGKVYLLPSDQHLRDFVTMHHMNHHGENLKLTLEEAISSQGDKTLGSGSSNEMCISDTPAVTSESSNCVEENGPKDDISAKDVPTDDESQESPERNDLPEGATDALTGSVDDDQLLASISTSELTKTAKSSSPKTNGKSKRAGISSASKAFYNEQLFSRFGINYNNEPEILKKGVFLVRQKIPVTILKGVRLPTRVYFYIEDLTKDDFWKDILEDKTVLKAKFEKLLKFERLESLTPHAWVVVRIDGRAFHKLSKQHNFEKPNDLRAIQLMNIAAATVMHWMPDIVISYGESDEYSFVFDRYGSRYPRSTSALVAQCVSLFTGAYVKNWRMCFGEDCRLKTLPVFDGRSIEYPTNTSLRDYLSWRQADCHINNLYNTAFWGLINLRGYSNVEADKKLSGTFSRDKRALLLEMGIEYDEEPTIHRKGSVIYRKRVKARTQNKLKAASAIVREARKDGRSAAWWNAECEAAKAKRNNLRKLYEVSPSQETLRSLLEEEINARKVIRNAKAKFNASFTLTHPAIEVSSDETKSLSTSKDSDSTLTNTSTSNTSSDSSSEKLLEGEKPLSSVALASGHVAEDLEMIPATLSTEKPRDNKETPSRFFNKKGKSWWTYECHNAKVSRMETMKAFKKDPTQENEFKFRMASLQFRVLVSKSKAEMREMRKMSAKDRQKKVKVVEQKCEADDEKKVSTIAMGLTDKAEASKDAHKSISIGDEQNLDSEFHRMKIESPKPEKDFSDETENPKAGENITIDVPKMNITPPIGTEPNESVKSKTSELDKLADGRLKTISEQVARHQVFISSLQNDLVLCFDDVIGHEFWRKNKHLLGTEKSALAFEDL
ncbi:uncharacterized protein LOC108676602 isoform X2 [Hyalella azteca]|nr:uncharacterized protein LOC108676602 isoform X2 [Hyalella azteca]